MQREADLVIVARLYLQKQTQAEIGRQLGLSQQQIGYDLKTLQKRWQESSVISIDTRKAEELARIDRLERVYWDAWERSLEAFKSTTQTAEGTGDSRRNRGTIKTEERDGDPRYLEGIRWCIQKRVDIIGIDAPKRNELTGTGGGPIRMQNISEEELDRRIAELIGKTGVAPSARGEAAQESAKLSI